MTSLNSLPSNWFVVASSKVRQYHAGHSLGGALALLAAYDIKEKFKFQHLSVHTFGAPRVGNHAFAR